MTSLGLLTAYCSSSEDEEASAPAKKTKFQNKDEDQDDVIEVQTPKQQQHPSSTKKKTLQLPMSVLNMFADSKHTDSPELHGGRKRTFAHERGNWATFLYTPYPVEYANIFKTAVSEAMKSLNHDWKICDDFHISLSRTVPLPHHCITPLFDELRKNIVGFEPFLVKLEPVVEFYTNDEKTRTFLSIRIKNESSNSLEKLVKIVDASFESFRLQRYYTNPSFHISFAWISDDVSKSDELGRDINILTEYFAGTFNENIFTFQFLVDRICLKSGNKIMGLDLS